MIDHISLANSEIWVHLGAVSLKTTKAFTHGGITVNTLTGTIEFKNHPPFPLPEGFPVAAGSTLKFQLVGPDGSPRKQTRAGVLRENQKLPGILRIPGSATTDSVFTGEEGWASAVYKYRAYFKHTGVPSQGAPSDWLKDSVERMKSYWNRLAWLCRDARRKCSPVPTDEVIAFVRKTVLPAIDEYNDSHGRSNAKQKIKHPANLKTEAPGLDGLWKFVGILRKRVDQKRPVPDGLLEQVFEFAGRFKADYTPLNDFLNNLDSIADTQAKDVWMPIPGKSLEEAHLTVELRPWEKRHVTKAFKAVIARRKTLKALWSDGWPHIKFPDAPGAGNWGLHYYFNRAGVKAELLESAKGVPGLTFGAALDPSATGHNELHGVAAKNRLRPAEISIPGYNHETWSLKFVVLQHRELPPDSHIKEWKLIFKDGALWLCLVLELKRPVSVPGKVSAGLDIGWRRTESGIRFGTLFETASETIRELTIDLQQSPKDHKDRTPFRIDMGPTRDEKRYIAKLLPNWTPGDPIPNALEIRTLRGKLTSAYKDEAKLLLTKHLGENLPTGFERAGVNGLVKLAGQMADNLIVNQIVDDLKRKMDRMQTPDSTFSKRTNRRLTSGASSRMEYGQLQVAHDVCRYLIAKGVNVLFTEGRFLSKIAQAQDNEDEASLKKSQKYRQFAAVARFVVLLKNTAAKYGITVRDVAGINTSRVCSKCNGVNGNTASETFVCSECASIHKQDENAAINLTRFGSDPKLAEWALRARLLDSRRGAVSHFSRSFD